MSCSICTCSASNRTPFYCPTCARSHLYTLRYENARVLLEKESIGKEVEAAVAGNTGVQRRQQQQNANTNANNNTRQASRERNLKWDAQAAQTEQARSSDRIRAMRDCIETLRSDIEQRKAQIRHMKLQQKQRRSDAESANFQLSERRNAALASIQNGIKRTEHLWHSLHNKTAESRIFLCREAAFLYGLRQEVGKREGGRKSEKYYIGGVQIVDLRSLNGASPPQISTALSNISHLLILVSHYLSLRLPAEIILPHRNHAIPTIFTPAASYSSAQDNLSDVYHPYNHSKPGDTRKHRARPLSVEKTLPKLVKEEPATYALFIEGVSLLAWNVSWLCRTQGLNIGSDSWEDICNIGKNMWQLLVSPTTAQNANTTTTTRAISSRETVAVRQKNSNQQQPKTIIQRTKSFPMLGHYSHGTSHSFLGASEGVEFMKTWKLPTPAKIADKLKSALLGEMANAEWELLEEKEWDDLAEGGRDNDAANPASQGGNRRASLTAMTMTKSNSAETVDDISSAKPMRTSLTSTTTTTSNSNNTRPSGTSGWTKLKSKQPGT
ncbi:hypothetical protein TMatcc_008301 [Talaromyces marneffei ATCC 18224]|uniref:Autophagy-related protein 14 n=1 Tax=Talaromyces marneffei (strain ATCC 18224 / CBS 334.59 / QM 7333) TaxID=441960 RepID=B6QMH1_TALMQ|nr:uncharacterized protein EYB26_007651 [Talaromyces marneffei]EEA22259.1 conserved hypothetical protein [Talaromyces marneffei ATCC 18224]KAE8550288.1 hypothetical protein EYB25_006512 [Talaromyces marneffei]QGA19953.1 hypothetical protein EYB26_007651 [Talaromyces marneffei]